MKEGTIWIDVSDLKIWSGQHTGIQRVVYNLAIRYAQQPNVRFVVFNNIFSVFEDFDFLEYADNHIEQANLGISSGEGSAQTRRSVRKIAKIAASRGMAAAKSVASPRLKRTIKHALARVSDKSPHPNVLDAITQEDMFIVLGGYWGNPNFMPHILGHKKAVGFKFVHIIYDLIPWLATGFVLPFVREDFERYMELVFQQADGLMAISKSTQKDIHLIQAKYNYPRVVTAVMRLGENFTENKNPHKPKINIESNRFLLCVGTVEVRKNHALLYYAAKEAKRRGLGFPKIVIVGKLGWLATDIYHVMTNDEDTKSTFIFLHNADDNELAWLYQNCLFTVYPAFYEGWGLPIAESLFYNKMCLASNTTSMPEVAGDLIDYFSPYSSSECLEKILEYMDTGKLLSKTAQIIKTYKPTSWDATFTEFDTFTETVKKL